MNGASQVFGNLTPTICHHQAFLTSVPVDENDNYTFAIKPNR